jgi:streptomycin 6-kinase
VSPSAFVRDLPAAVAAKARDLGAHAWLENLPALVEAVRSEWGLRLGVPFRDATEAYVVEALPGDGTPAVLKLLISQPHGAREISTLRAIGGDGCCRLLEYDEARGALLLERLGPAMSELDLPPATRLEILADLAARIWRPASGPLPTGADHAARMSRYIRAKWRSLGEPCTREAVEQALAAADSRRRAHDAGRAVLAHGDIHQWNALRVPGTADFRLVDPDGLIAEPELDLGVLMREDPAELLDADPWDRCRWLAGRTGTDAQAIWEWGLADRVATGLTLTVAGLQPVASQMLAAADAISRAT